MAKRRVPKVRKIEYPEAIQKLIAGEPVERNAQNADVLIDAYYFNQFPELPAEVLSRAGQVLAAWRPTAYNGLRRSPFSVIPE
ncbi:MAG: hypothetical protein JO038_07220 [Alphaproteobacteria bacterium]|nr:hypothetical protein [Alphaproteobacteria bacterium]